MQEQDVLMKSSWLRLIDMLSCAGNERRNVTLHMHNNGARSEVHHERAFLLLASWLADSNAH